MDQNDLDVAKQLGALNAKVASFASALKSHGDESKRSRTKIYDAIARIDKETALIQRAVADMDKRLAEANTAISNFKTIKAQATGAKMAVLTMWAIFGSSLVAIGVWVSKKFGI